MQRCRRRRLGSQAVRVLLKPGGGECRTGLPRRPTGRERTPSACSLCARRPISTRTLAVVSTPRGRLGGTAPRPRSWPEGRLTRLSMAVGKAKRAGGGCEAGAEAKIRQPRERLSELAPDPEGITIARYFADLDGGRSSTTANRWVARAKPGGCRSRPAPGERRCRSGGGTPADRRIGWGKGAESGLRSSCHVMCATACAGRRRAWREDRAIPRSGPPALADAVRRGTR